MAPEPAPSKAWRVSLQLVQYGDGLVWLAEIRRPGEVIGIRVADLDAVEAVACAVRVARHGIADARSVRGARAQLT